MVSEPSRTSKEIVGSMQLQTEHAVMIEQLTIGFKGVAESGSDLERRERPRKHAETELNNIVQLTRRKINPLKDLDRRPRIKEQAGMEHETTETSDVRDKRDKSCGS